MKNLILILFIANFANAQSVFVAATEGPVELLLNGNDLYIAASSINPPTNKILKIDITVPNPTPVDVVTGLSSPRGMVIKDNDLYIAEDTGDKISKIDLTATNPVPVDVVTGLSSPRGMVIKDNDLYVAEYAADKISKIDLTATNPIPVDVVTGLTSGPTGLVLQGNILYIAESIDTPSIQTIDITSTTPTVSLVSSGVIAPIGIAMSGNDLYVAEYLGSKVSKIDVTTGVKTDILTGLAFPSGLALVGDDLYVTEFFTDQIIKINLATLSVTDSNIIEPRIVLYPNPANEFLQIYGLTGKTDYVIYNLLGAEIKKGTISNNEEIDIGNLTNGSYILQLRNKNAIKFTILS